MKTFLKLLGTTALLAAVVPIRVQKDEETGKTSYQSLLWKLNVTPAGEDGKTEVGLDLANGVLTAPLMNALAAKAEEEPHLFTDSLHVDYDAKEGDVFPEEEAVVEAAIDSIPPVDPVAPEAPTSPETSEVPEAPEAPDTPKAE